MVNDFFKYDLVLSLTDNTEIIGKIQSVKEEFAEHEILAAVFNHRFYSLQKKNYIKAILEADDLDHMMFSLKPSSHDFVDILASAEIDRFKYYSQLIFILQVMARNNIKTGIIDESGLDLPQRSDLSAEFLVEKVENYLIELENTLNINNVEKQFAPLFSVRKVYEKVAGSSILALSDYAAIDVDMARYDLNQIASDEEDIFWLGFDPAFKIVPHEKAYPQTKWTQLIRMSEQGKGLFEKDLRYCARCCLPETMEGMELDEIGICIPCRSSEEKMHINWEERRKYLEKLIDSYRRDDYYDCMLPMSGGKDSTYQAYLLDKRLNVTPLAVTHGQNWLSMEGRYNLENCLQQFDLDHIIFIKKRSVINKVARKSLNEIGDVCWHCHIGNGTFSIQCAIAWDIDLMLWGESVAEVDGRGSYSQQSEASLVYNLEISARIPAQELVDDITPARDLSAWMYPSQGILDQTSIKYLHLGDYFFWDEERQFEFVKRNYNWLDTKVENTFKGYKSVECVMAGVHDYSNFIKRGIGRATMHAAEDVRRGILTREEGMELSKQYDSQRPHALDYYLDITGIDEKEYEETLFNARTKSDYASRLKYK
jgi:N-acetyl sugar amidotransferase